MDRTLHTAVLAAFVDHHMQSWLYVTPFESSDNVLDDIVAMHGGPFDEMPDTLDQLVVDVINDLHDGLGTEFAEVDKLLDWHLMH